MLRYMYIACLVFYHMFRPDILTTRPFCSTFPSLPVFLPDVGQYVRLVTEGDDTRGCGDTIGPPDDEQLAARNMLRSVV